MGKKGKKTGTDLGEVGRDALEAVGETLRTGEDISVNAEELSEYLINRRGSISEAVAYVKKKLTEAFNSKVRCCWCCWRWWFLQAGNTFGPASKCSQAYNRVSVRIQRSRARPCLALLSVKCIQPQRGWVLRRPNLEAYRTPTQVFLTTFHVYAYMFFSELTASLTRTTSSDKWLKFW